MLSATNPFSFVLFGASGHLAKLKIYPALYTLALKKRLPKDYVIMGFSRTKLTQAKFRALVEKSIRDHMPAVTEAVLKDFLKHCQYTVGHYDQTEDFKTLNQNLSKLEKGWKKKVRLAYLSIPPSVFQNVLDNLCAGGVHQKSVPFRCIVEKPVGDNLASAEAILKSLKKCFKEKEVYLLDHYLGKESVRNIYYLRFANPLLERVFKNTLIHHVEVTASEPGGIEGRAGYFENTGTFRDMLQSHLLMMASLLTMRLQTEKDFLPGRLNAMEQFYLPPATNLDDVVLQGQYGSGKVNGVNVIGYKKEPDVSNTSRTNTYAALKLMSRTSRWQGVPFYLRSGKRLNKKETRISIEFQEPRQVGKGSYPNRLDIIMQGEAGMRVWLQTKLGGTAPEFRPMVLEDPLVCIGDCLPEHGLLILEAIHGVKQWFLTFDEVRTSWRLMDPIQTHLDDPKTKLYNYKAGSHGPTEVNKWIAKDRTKWMD